MQRTQSITLHAGTIELSGWYRAPEGPARALLVGVHGGSYDSMYFDYRSRPDASFHDLAHVLGFAVLSIDRPGYGATLNAEPSQSAFDVQAPLINAAIADAIERYGDGLGIFLIGHSIGGMLALYVAALPAHVPIIGIEASGIGMIYQPGFREARAAAPVVAGASALSTDARAAFMYGPPGTYDPVVQAEDLRNARSAPKLELADAFAWPDTFARLGPNVRVPVRINIAEHDRLWQSTPAAIDAVRAVLPNAPVAEVRAFLQTGHSTHGHLTARAHYLDMLSFAEQCIVRAREA